MRGQTARCAQRIASLDREGMTKVIRLRGNVLRTTATYGRRSPPGIPNLHAHFLRDGGVPSENFDRLEIIE